MAEFFIKATMPDALVEEFLQLLRTWDGGKTDRHLNILGESPTLEAAQLAETLQRLAPAIPYTHVEALQAFQGTESTRPDFTRGTDQNIADRLRQIRRALRDLAMREMELENEEVMLMEKLAKSHAENETGGPS